MRLLEQWHRIIHTPMANLSCRKTKKKISPPMQLPHIDVGSCGSVGGQLPQIIV